MTASPASNPFIVHRRRLDVYAHARATGLDDEAYCQLVAEADRRLAGTAGIGFRSTPLVDLDLAPEPGQPGIDGEAGAVVAKIETGSVGGSHKARHLFGLLLRLLIDDQAGPARSGGGRLGDPPLAIASCGNAALGAALVAASAERTLRVFVPTDADPSVLAELERLGAAVTVCARSAGDPPGDPCVVALDDAVERGAAPFTVQGSRVPEVIDGARTLGLELAAQLEERGVAPARLFVQIGGGALATAVMDGLARARPGAAPPRLHPVQADAAHPYLACWRRARSRLLDEAGIADPGTEAARAELLARSFEPDRLRAVLAAAPDLMVPWPEAPRSLATGILDDVTYDWPTVMVHQVRSGGWPLTVSEAMLARAARLAARQVAPPPDETGAAGLAGLLTMAAECGAGTAPGEVNVVLLTGVRRS
ncbi:MAG: pyridoxal-phosphate dependent enzyme [Actinomycetota bacterium]